MAENNTNKMAENCKGSDAMKQPKCNKGLAFSFQVRQQLRIHGLLPPLVLTQDQQVQIVIKNFYRWTNDLDRYIYLMSLKDRNEKLFFRVMSENIELLMPIIYGSSVGLCYQKSELIFSKPRGLFITIHDKGHIYDILCNWPEHDIKAIVVTDGERILGLGDLGAFGMWIPFGKMTLYTVCAGVNPHQCLPVTLDVGTNTESLIKDPMYIGLHQKRTTGPAYDEFIDEFMKAVVKKYGRNTLVQFEDFANHNAFRFLDKYQDLYCTFNDDIQGTAAVTLAGLIASTRITGQSLSQGVYLFQGAGEAAIGIASLLAMAMEAEGTSREDAIERIWLVDSRGLIVKDRPKGGLNSLKAQFAVTHAPVDLLEEVVRAIKPTCIIGVSAIPGAFTTQIIKDMAEFNEKPVIFALSNPTSKAECTAEQAYSLTKGRAVFASGSPFPPFTINRKTLYPGQCNNTYIFPAVALAVILFQIKHIDEMIFKISAEALASMVTNENLAEGRLYPPLDKIREVSTVIATHIGEYVYKNKMASFYPEPQDKQAFIRSQLYNTEYESIVSSVYDCHDMNSLI